MNGIHTHGTLKEIRMTVTTIEKHYFDSRYFTLIYSKYDVVEIASYSPFVNVCGAIATDAEGVLKRAQYYVFELFSKVFRQCDGYVETHMEGETYSLPEVIDYSNRKAEAKFALDAKSAQRIVKTNYIDCVAAINDNHSRMSISLINKNSEDGYEVELSVLGSKVQWNTGNAIRFIMMILRLTTPERIRKMYP